jgi:hypothetical protein
MLVGRARLVGAAVGPGVSFFSIQGCNADKCKGNVCAVGAHESVRECRAGLNVSADDSKLNGINAPACNCSELRAAVYVLLSLPELEMRILAGRLSGLPIQIDERLRACMLGRCSKDAIRV